MICPDCGEFLVQEVLQSEARMIVHRLLRHQPPVVQWAATLGLTIGGLVLIGRIVRWTRR